jgi:hypothetical protein
MINNCNKQPDHKPFSSLTEEELLKQPIIQLQASELVANRFLKYCKVCGHPVVQKYLWNWEYLEPQKLHECKETKKERLQHLNEKTGDI